MPQVLVTHRLMGQLKPGSGAAGLALGSGLCGGGETAVSDLGAPLSGLEVPLSLLEEPLSDLEVALSRLEAPLSGLEVALSWLGTWAGSGAGPQRGEE